VSGPLFSSRYSWRDQEWVEVTESPSGRLVVAARGLNLDDKFAEGATDLLPFEVEKLRDVLSAWLVDHPPS
jgi:hypothetical protein